MKMMTDDFNWKGSIYLPLGTKITKEMLYLHCSCPRGKPISAVSLVANPELMSGQCSWCKPMQVVFSEKPEEHFGVEKW